MKTRFGRFVVLAVWLAVPAPVHATIDGSAPFLCAITTIMECDDTGQCQRHAASQHPDFPAFLRIDVAERRITDGNRTGRSTEIRSTTRLGGRLILQGGENGRGWSATIVEDTGRMSAGIVADDFAFALFGACTTP
jgi:hypothetical protein